MGENVERYVTIPLLQSDIRQCDAEGIVRRTAYKVGIVVAVVRELSGNGRVIALTIARIICVAESGMNVERIKHPSRIRRIRHIYLVHIIRDDH